MKTALVTGAYKGLGYEWCRQAGKLGYTVILTARDFAKAQAASDILTRQGLDIYPRALEVTSEQQLAEIAGWVNEKFGKLDLLINNAGINPKDFTDKSAMAKAFYLNDLDARTMLDVIHINSIAPLLAVKHFRQVLQNSERPVVINISSWLGSVTNLRFGGHYGYVGSKNLLNILNKSMANELNSDGIICVNVNPGWVQTDMGGQKARFTAEQAVSAIIHNVVDKVTIADTGKFLDYDGTEHPW